MCTQKSIPAVNFQLQKEADSINSWYKENRMKLNVEKTKCMLLSSRQKLRSCTGSDLDVNIEGSTIHNVVNEKRLGVEIDNFLSCKEQIKKVKRAINFKISLLRRIRKYLLQNILQSLYQATLRILLLCPGTMLSRRTRQTNQTTKTCCPTSVEFPKTYSFQINACSLS